MTARPDPIPSVLILLSLWLVVAAGCTHDSLRVQSPDSGHGLTVSGRGEASAPPDIARLDLGVEMLAPSAEQGSSQVAQRMTAVIAALRQAGVGEADIQTRGLSMYQERPQRPRPLPTGEGPQPAPRQPAMQYRVTNMVQVSVRALDQAATVLQAATAAGANKLHGIRFEIEDPQPLIEQARQQAVQRAKRSAAQLAELTGVPLGKLVAIREGVGRPVPMGQAMGMRTAMAESAMPIERGELTVSHSVELVYALP